MIITTDLICLLLLALWSVPLNHAPALGRVFSGDTKAGLEWAMSSRDEPREGPLWVGRADRAQRNHHDNLALTATVILVAQITGQANEITATASVVILAARVAHAVFYLAGISPLRSLSYVVALLGTFAIVWQILV